MLLARRPNRPFAQPKGGSPEDHAPPLPEATRPASKLINRGKKNQRQAETKTENAPKDIQQFSLSTLFPSKTTSDVRPLPLSHKFNTQKTSATHHVFYLPNQQVAPQFKLPKVRKK